MSTERTEISSLGEFGLIEKLTAQQPLNNATTVLGIGDDAAIIDPMGKHIVVSTDLLVEGIHFDLGFMPLKHVGYKSVIVNLSDIYAMNATPTQITVSIAVSNRFSVEALEELYAGIYLACDRHHVDLVGGDTTGSPKGLTISITAIGEVNANEYVTRKGAQINDLICVSGDLGAAYLGLLVLTREKKIHAENPNIQPDLENYAYVIGRLMKPEARGDVIALLSKEGITPTSMIDISDGLSSELKHICKQSNVGCMIYEDKLPIVSATTEAAHMFKLVDTMAALNGGDDYELLFTINQKDYEKISRLEDISIIGHITEAGSGAQITTKGGNVHALEAQGWTHF